jgi:hypothetical protein
MVENPLKNCGVAKAGESLTAKRFWAINII